MLMTRYTFKLEMNRSICQGKAPNILRFANRFKGTDRSLKFFEPCPRHNIFPSDRDVICAIFDSSVRDFSIDSKFFDLKIFDSALAANTAVDVAEIANNGEEAFLKIETIFETAKFSSKITMCPLSNPQKTEVSVSFKSSGSPKSFLCSRKTVCIPSVSSG